MPAPSSTRVRLGERESRGVEATGGKSPGRGVKGAEARQTAGRACRRQERARSRRRMRPSRSRGGPRGPALGPGSARPSVPVGGPRALGPVMPKAHFRRQRLRPQEQGQAPGEGLVRLRRWPARRPAPLRSSWPRPRHQPWEALRRRYLHPRFKPPLFCKICCEALSFPFRHQLVLKNLVSWFILPPHWGSRTAALLPRESPAACAHPRDLSGLRPHMHRTHNPTHVLH